MNTYNTNAEVNAAIAEKKGWRKSPGLIHWDWCGDDGMRHCNPTDDPREWATLMLEMLDAGIDCLFCDDGSFEASRGYTGSPDAFCAASSWKPSIGEAVCRTWLAWRESQATA